ncbi:MAG: coiled coil protein [Legionella longbeachae]|nr:coiled coil protein [Legionella longbeachae]
MDILKRLLASLLGLTILPLRALAYNLVYALIVLLTGVGVVIGLPISIAIFFKDQGIPNELNLLLTTIFIIPIVTVLTTITLALIGLYLIYHTLSNMLEFAWLGLKNGLSNGMEGFWQVMNSQRFQAESIFEYVGAFLDRINSNSNPPANSDVSINDVDFDGFQRFGELTDVVVVHEDLEVPDLQSKESQKVHSLLSPLELKQIEALINEFKSLKEPISSQLKQILDQLNTLYNQYKDLDLKLQQVQQALISRNKSEINDELIAYNEVEKPILLVKQYKRDDHWYNVPACSYVTDRDSFLHWLKTSPQHPINKDFLKKPQAYNAMETQYIWYELSKENCSSQELGEAAAQMQVLSNQLLTELSESQKKNLGLSVSSQSFFGLKTVPFSDTLSPNEYKKT